MRRIWLEKSEIQEPHFELEGEAFRHAILVSRFRESEEFEVVYGGPEALQVRILKIGKKSAQVEVIGRRALPQLPKPWVNLAFAASKWPVFEEVLEKSVELGVNSIQPLLTDFSFIRKKSEWPEARQARLQKIIQSATEQSGRSALMELRAPLTLEEFVKPMVNRPAGTECLFAYEGPSALGVRQALQPFKNPSTTEIWAVIGSEGGFSPAEVEFMKSSGFPPITLGPQILRAETACFALVSVIKYELDLLRDVGGTNGSI